MIDILTDAKRRQWGNSCDSPKGKADIFTCVILTANEPFILAFVFLCIVVITLLDGGMGETKYKLVGANEMQKVIQLGLVGQLYSAQLECRPCVPRLPNTDCEFRL